ncbi:MAG: hypothetical protein LBH14_07925 [Desulfobulbaceae bacterium]|nr:hypothetical protein [Desulfobulbaceae bacterium]
MERRLRITQRKGQVKKDDPPANFRSVTIFLRNSCEPPRTNKTVNKPFAAFAPSFQTIEVSFIEIISEVCRKDGGRLAAGKAAVKRRRALNEVLWQKFTAIFLPGNKFR